MIRTLVSLVIPNCILIVKFFASYPDEDAEFFHFGLAHYKSCRHGKLSDWIQL